MINTMIRAGFILILPDTSYNHAATRHLVATATPPRPYVVAHLLNFSS
jgi:hypothetical protein